MGLFNWGQKGSDSNKIPGNIGNKNSGINGSKNLVNQFSNTSKIFIKQISIQSSEDFRKFQANLQAGNIMIVDFRVMTELGSKSTDPQFSLQAQLSWLKQYCLKQGGAITKLQEHVFLVTPNKNFHISN